MDSHPPRSLGQKEESQGCCREAFLWVSLGRTSLAQTLWHVCWAWWAYMNCGYWRVCVGLLDQSDGGTSCSCSLPLMLNSRMICSFVILAFAHSRSEHLGQILRAFEPCPYVFSQPGFIALCQVLFWGAAGHITALYVSMLGSLPGIFRFPQEQFFSLIFEASLETGSLVAHSFCNESWYAQGTGCDMIQYRWLNLGPLFATLRIWLEFLKILKKF